MAFLHLPLLLRAVCAGVHGQSLRFANGCAFDAGFIYLDGTPDPAALDALHGRWGNRMFIPLSGAWEQALEAYEPQLVRTRRCQMQAGPGNPAKLAAYAADIAEGYLLRDFDEEAFALHPFGHGRGYPDYAAFARTGAGAVVWYNGKIVASASSFISFAGEAELDVSTLAQHRRRGLALACCAAMLMQCARRGIAVHWDAQNDASRALAEKLGFVLDTSYTAYSFFTPEIP